MDKYSDTVCPNCHEEELVQVQGDWLCPDCDSTIVFETVPDNETFTV